MQRIDDTLRKHAEYVREMVLNCDIVISSRRHSNSVNLLSLPAQICEQKRLKFVNDLALLCTARPLCHGTLAEGIRAPNSIHRRVVQFKNNS